MHFIITTESRAKIAENQSVSRVCPYALVGNVACARIILYTRQ